VTAAPQLAAADAEAARAAVRLEVRQLVAAIAASVPTLDATGATWADLTLDVALRDHLRAALTLLDS
jgi:hypothetical protein